MKKTLLALLLVLALCLPTFVGCDTSETPKQTEEKPSGDVVEQDTTVDDGNKGEDKNKDYSEIYKNPYDIYEELTSKGYTGTFEEWVESLKGADGADGKSAYQLAVENGYTGTVEEWLLSLVGAPGRDGADGKDGVDGAPGKDGEDGEDGKDGLDGKSVYDLAVENGFKGTVEEWLLSLVGADGKDGVDGAPGKDGADGAPGKDGEDGKDGDKGDKGDTGAAGNGILSIEKTSSDGRVDTYTITFTDGSKTTFTITNGADGEDGKDGVDGAPGKDGVDGEDGKDGADGAPGKDGADGADGLTPYIGENGNWWIGDKDTGIKAEGKDGIDGEDGADGAPGKDGEDGEDGADGAPGKDGEDGADGLTPYIGENGNWWIGNEDTGIKAEGKDGADGADGKDGADGEDGKDGADGAPGKDGADGADGLTPYIGENGNWWIGDKDTGIKAEGKDGVDGEDGEDGADGAPGKDGADGADGLTPYIGENGNWWIGDKDTGIKAEGKDGIDGEDGADGAPGKDGADGEDGKDGADGEDGKDGADGAPGKDGEDGNGIASIEKTSSNGLVDTYTITFTDGSTTTFTVTNGDQGDKGDQGDAGVGIDKIEIVNGELIVTYTDGREVNLGAVSEGSNTSCLSFYPLPDGTYAVGVGNAKYLEKISIPSSYCGKAVTRIADEGFASMTNLVTLTIPSSVKTIDANAFYHCISLTTVIFDGESNLESVAQSAFDGCSALSEIAYSGTVDKAKALFADAFEYAQIDVCISCSNGNYYPLDDGTSGDIPVDPDNNYGTLTSPVSTTTAYNACSGLASGSASAEPFYVKGTVTEIGQTGSYYKNVYFTDGTTNMLIYTINMGEGVSGFEVGDTIIAYGYVKNYDGTIEMATNGNTFVIVVEVLTSSGSDGEPDGGDDTEEHTYTDFTSEEKAIFTESVGFVIPFIANDEYYVEEYSSEEYGEYGVNFYAFGNTTEEFEAYLELFSSYTNDGTDVDEYGDTWYFFSKGDVYVDMTHYFYESEYVVDVYVYIVEEEGGSTGGSTGGDESESGNGTLTSPVSTTTAYNACLGLASGSASAEPFYVKGTVTEIGQTGSYYKNVYFTDGTTEMLIYTINMSEGISGFEVGDTIIAYGYIKNYNGTIEMATNQGVYVYVVSVESSGGSSGNTDSNLMTNEGAGLPEDSDGVYDVDFTKGNYVQNVTEQGYYMDGCPTTGTPAVLVIPVEFSDITAASKGYTIEDLEKIFNGSVGDTSYYSLHDYYFISSYNKLDLDVTVLDSWFRPANKSSYYADATYDYYGTEMSIGDQLILDEALAYLSTVMDLSEFDSDKNGMIDAVVMVNTLDIDAEEEFRWAYRYWNVYTDDEGYYFEYDAVSANDYIWMSYQFMFEAYDEETGEVNYDSTNPLNPYTFIHEFGHVLGADDYYDTSYVTSPMNGLDVMDAMVGDHNPYTKFNYGWITDSRLVVTDSTVTLTLEAFEKSGDTLILASNWDESLGAYQEYYVIMYYTATGLNSGEGGYFLRDGVVVYHINSTLYAEDYGDETYYDVYNNNTDVSDESGTKDNLVEYVQSSAGNYTYAEGDTLPEVVDDLGNTLGYTFTVDSVTADCVTITFEKIG